MSLQVRGIPRFHSFLHRCIFTRTQHLQRAMVCAVRKLRGLTVLVAVALAWAGAGSALAQTPAPASADAPVTAAEPKAADINFAVDKSSFWSAPEPWRTDQWYFQFAYYTLHFHYDPDHQQSYLFDAEYHFKETWLGGQWIAGLCLFQNSFGQFSQYIFGGLQWRPIEEHQPFYVKLSAGALHGYEGQYKDKVPFNSSGTAPAIIPSVGYCHGRICGEFVLLGTNAALFTIGMTIP